MCSHTHKRVKKDHSRYDHAFCLAPETAFKNVLLGPFCTESPMKAEIRLNCGVNAFACPVPKGEPTVGSEGYNVHNCSSSETGFLGNHTVLMYVRN